MLAYQVTIDRERLDTVLRDPRFSSPAYVHHGREIWNKIPRLRMHCYVTPEIQNEICARLSLAEYVGRHTALSALATNIWRGKCPYCTGPECRINVVDLPRNGRGPWYFCTGTPGSYCCSAAGSIIGLQMRMRNVSFVEAILDLCEDADLPPPSWEAE